MLVLVATCLGTACASQQRAPSSSAGDTTAITGRARDAVTGEPLAAATVTLVGSDGERLSVRTDGVGAFALAARTTGDAVLRVDVAEAMPTERRILLRRGNPIEVDIFVYRPTTAGEPAPPVEIRSGVVVRYLRRAKKTGRGSIEGIATDSESSGLLAGAAISLFAESRSLADATVTTIADGDGRFAVEELVPGLYTISVYYQVVGRASIEIRRANLEVRADQTLFVELEIDTRAP